MPPPIAWPRTEVSIVPVGPNIAAHLRHTWSKIDREPASSMTDATTVSVVVASGAGGPFLFRCLDSLRDQAAAHQADVIVVDRCGEPTSQRVEREYPFVTLIKADVSQGRPTVQELRRQGAWRARGEVVAILEEHKVAPPDWLDVIRRSFQPGDAAIGGPILDADYSRLRDWVVYFSEYHNYMPPWEDGDRYQLNGANVAYCRRLLLEHDGVLGTGYWEVVLYPRLARQGRFRAVPAMGVYHVGPYDYGYYLGQRYFVSRAWGGSQRRTASLLRRLAYLIAAPLVPLLLLGRVVHRAAQSKHRLGKLLLALPLLLPTAVAYVWGEWLGYLVGAGRALEFVE
jgi:hypothetical protein